MLTIGHVGTGGTGGARVGRSRLLSVDCSVGQTTSTSFLGGTTTTTTYSTLGRPRNAARFVVRPHEVLVDRPFEKAGGLVGWIGWIGWIGWWGAWLLDRLVCEVTI